MLLPPLISGPHGIFVAGPAAGATGYELTFAPLQLGAQNFEVGLALRTYETQTFGRSGDVYAIVSHQLDADLTVQRDIDRLVAPAENNLHLRVSGMTNGRLVRVCGQIGVITNAP